MKRLVWGALLVLVTPVETVMAADSDFTACDGYGPPSRKSDGITTADWLWGLASGSSDIRRSDGIGFNESTFASCNVALADPRLIDAFWLRRAHLLQAKALHAIATSKPDLALELLDQSDAVGKSKSDPLFAQSLGMGNLTIRAFVYGNLEKTADFVATAQHIAALRPWSSSTQRLANDILLRAPLSDQKYAEQFRATMPLLPENALTLFVEMFLRGDYAAATTIAPGVSFDLPRNRSGWSIEGDLYGELKTIELRTEFAAMWAYALTTTGQSERSKSILDSATHDLDEAGALPQPDSNGKPPKKWIVEGYFKRQPYVARARGRLSLWRRAMAFRMTVLTRLPDDVLAQYEQDDFKSLSIAPDIFGRVVLLNPADISARDDGIKNYRMRLASERQRPKLSLAELAAILPRPETAAMVPVLKRAGDGYFLSDTGLSRSREGTSDVWTIRYTHPVASIASVEELAMLGAAQTAQKQAKDGFIILSRRTFSRITHIRIYNYTQDENSGYEAQVRVRFLNLDTKSEDTNGMEGRIIRVSDVVEALSKKYPVSK